MQGELVDKIDYKVRICGVVYKEEEKDMTNMVKLESMKNPQVVQKIERRCSTVDRKECHPAQDQH